KIEEAKIAEWYNLEIAKINQDLYNEQARKWNDHIDNMAGSLKGFLRETARGEWDDFGDYLDNLWDRLKNSFADMATSMVVDWIAAMFKMQENANLNVNVSGGGGVGGIAQGLLGDKNILDTLFKGLGGDLGKGFIGNLKKAGLGNLLKYGAAGYNYSTSAAAYQTTAAYGAEAYGALGMQTAAQDMTAAAATQTAAASATQVAMKQVAKYIPVVGAAYGVYSTVAGAMKDPKKSGSGAGYGQAALTGAMIYGPIGAIIMTAIYGITSAITKSGKVRRERQQRASM
ncbi:unnamed protein product, partial [marine sediment metagenome]